MPKFDITKLNVAVDKLLENYGESQASVYASSVWPSPLPGGCRALREILAPDMTITDPVSRFRYTDLEFELRGQDEVRSLYRMWAEHGPGYLLPPERAEVAVADHFVRYLRHCVPASIGKGTEAGEVFVLSSKRYLPASS